MYYVKYLYFKLIEICLAYLLLHCTKVMQVDSILEITAVSYGYFTFEGFYFKHTVFSDGYNKSVNKI